MECCSIWGAYGLGKVVCKNVSTLRYGKVSPTRSPVKVQWRRTIYSGRRKNKVSGGGRKPTNEILSTDSAQILNFWLENLLALKLFPFPSSEQDWSIREAKAPKANPGEETKAFLYAQDNLRQIGGRRAQFLFFTVQCCCFHLLC